MGATFPKYKTISSAIVGGILPIGLGLSRGIKMRGKTSKVWCFIGDTTSETNMFHGVEKYSRLHNFPLNFVIEDNEKSVCSNTRQMWNTDKLTYEPENYIEGSVVQVRPNIVYFKYHSRFPHAGGLKRVQF